MPIIGRRRDFHDKVKNHIVLQKSSHFVFMLNLKPEFVWKSQADKFLIKCLMSLLEMWLVGDIFANSLVARLSTCGMYTFQLCNQKAIISEETFQRVTFFLWFAGFR